MVNNVSGVHLARKRPDDNELVHVLASTCSRPVSKIISIFFEQHGSGCSCWTRARDRAGMGRGGFRGSGRVCMSNGVLAGARRTRRLVCWQRKHDGVLVRWAVARASGCSVPWTALRVSVVRSVLCVLSLCALVCASGHSHLSQLSVARK